MNAECGIRNLVFSLVALLFLSVSGFAQTTYTKVTSASGLEAGANYLIVAHDENLGVLAMGNQKANNRNAVVVNEDGETITLTPGTDPNSEMEVFQFTLGGNAGAWTLYDEVKGGYLYAASSSNNNLKTQTTLNANGQWNISFNADGTAEVVAQGENTHNNMRFNPNTANNAPLFSCYAENTNVNTLVSFYKVGVSGLEAYDAPTLSLYPNPARDQVSLVLANDAQVSICDVTGRKVSEMNAAAGNVQLSVSELENGVYFVNIRYANGTMAVSKFVKF